MSAVIRSVVISGVGGQGLLTMGELLGEALIERGFKVSVGEIHGLSQRGGSVVVFVKYGDVQPSPIVVEGEANALVGLELIETARRVQLLAPTGIVLANNYLLPPPASQKIPGREELIEAIRRAARNVILINAVELARKAGSPVAVNMVMLGALAASGTVDLGLADLKGVVEKKFTGRTGEVNARALILGFEEAQKQLREKA
ncbi:MAG: indolepyruvate oxidoreductase subunit beta [Thermofilum sp.]